MVLEGIATSIGEKLSGCLLRPIGKQICNMYNFKSNIASLEKQAEELELKKESVMKDIEDATRRGESTKEEVVRWLSQVEGLAKRLAELTNEGDEEKMKKKCFKGVSCPNLKTLYSHSKEAVKLAEDVADLLNKGAFPRVGNYNPPQRTLSVYVNENDDFASRQSIFDDVIETLKNTDIKAIGLHGMGGVGKTTLVKRVYWQAKKDGLFDQVVMAEVTQHQDLKKIQGDIAGHLGLIFQDESVDARAARLRQRLKENNVLVILDDLWNEINLDAIGIPFGSADQRDLRLLLTSRDQDVCKKMKAKKEIPIQPLSSDEAMMLFWRIVNDSAKQSQFESIAVKIVEKCGYLPIAISAIASALKDKDDSDWNNALNKVKAFWGEEGVLSVIELSYDFLANKDAGFLFLLCGLHKVGDPVHIDHLVRHAMGLGLFQYANTLKVVRADVDESIRYLKSANLFLEDDRKDSVKLHDVIHVVAQRIASRDKLFNIQDVSDLEVELEKDIYEDSKAISLPAISASQLSAILEFPQLKLLSLASSTMHWFSIPDHFFDGMKKLKVLDLTGVSLPSLTLSLAYLKNLRTLCFPYCALGDINGVGKLKKLEVLSFFGSEIKKLPQEIGELTRLKCLDLQHCWQLEVIPKDVLSKLAKLEELYMGNSFVRWDTEDNASLAELKRLDQLTVLNIHIMNVHVFPKDLSLEKLERYVIFIDEAWNRTEFDRYEMSKTLKLKFNDGHKVEHGVTTLLKKAEELHLDDLNGLKNVHPELGGEGFPDLKILHVQNDPHILHIVKLTEERDGHHVYPMLQSLFLCNLINLEKIFPGELTSEALGNLKIINVEECAALTHLIPFSMAKAFLHLQEIKVSGCTNLEEIVDKEMQDNNVAISEIVFRELHTLTLTYLPKLRNFGPTASLRCGEIVQEDDDNMILFGRKVSFPCLKNLTLCSLEIPNIWCNQLPSTYSFSETLTSLVVKKCVGLKFMLSSSMVNRLQQLEKLEVVNCESMEVIINKEGSSLENNINSICFPSLKRVSIQNCPNLKGFLSCSVYENHKARNEPIMSSKMSSTNLFFDEKIELPALEELELSSVNNLECLCTKSVASSLVQLQELKIKNCAKMKEIITEGVEKDPATDETLFPKLHSLYLRSLPELKMLCSFSGHAIELASLSHLEIQSCPNMQKFVSNPISVFLTPNLKLDELNPEENLHVDAIPLFDEKILLPHLKSLRINSMHHLRRLWHNMLYPASFCSLEKLNVGNCEKLCNVFPHTMLDRLRRLEVLTVRSCWSVEEIFDVPEGISSKAVIMFPELTYLELWNLEKLKSLYHGLHTSKWPSLKELMVGDCQNVEIFGSEYQSLCEEKESIPQPLFVVDKAAFPKLEELTLSGNDNLKEMWHGGFSQQYPLTPKVLKCWDNPNITKSSHYLLATDTLEVSYIYFKQIGGGCDNTYAAALRQLRELNVSYDGEESSESSDSLACLVSSWVSFQNLTNLKITYCNSGFKYLLTYPTAISLQQLTQLEVSRCEMIEGIIMPPTDEVNDEIVFRQLKYLNLYQLCSLTSFYSGNHILKFPSLERVVVNGCPNMKVFSEGVSITPGLQRIQFEEYDCDKWHWEGDLNSTIQKMFGDMVGLKSLDEFRLSLFPHLKNIWHGQIPFRFGCLYRLTVDKCADISSAIPLNLLSDLKRLYCLAIEECDSLEELIHLEGLDADHHSVLLPELEDLRLLGLPRLRNIWSTRHLEILGFTNLDSLFVSKCNNLQYIFTTTIILGLKQLSSVEIRDCAMLETIITEDREKDAAMSDIVVPKLNFIILESLPMLTCFHSGSNFLECSSLMNMTINNCPQMKTFVFTSTEDHDLQDTYLFSEKVAFPDLEELRLSKLPMVEHLWNESCRAFQHLETIEISECVNLKSLVPSSASLQSLKTLEVSQCDGLTSLVTLLTAKSLEQLFRINVADCKTMREIITHLHIGDEENDRVVFGQLKYIGLHCLPNIIGFYSGNYTIEFPALKQVVVRQCKKINTFSKGVVSTPKLKRVQRTEDEGEGRWQNDLNTTVQLLFEEANVQHQKE